MKLRRQVNWQTSRNRKVLANKPTRMKQVLRALDQARDASHFLRLMEINNKPKFMKITMTIPKLEYSLELTQALAPEFIP